MVDKRGVEFLNSLYIKEKRNIKDKLKILQNNPKLFIPPEYYMVVCRA